MIKRLTNKDNSIRTKFLYYSLQAIFSLILSRVVVEWYLLSRFDSQYTILYNFLWENTGYIASLLIVIWFIKWNKKGNDLLMNNLQPSEVKPVKGYRYLFQLIFLIFSISVITIYSFFLLKYIFNYDNNISEIVLISLDKTSQLITQNFIFVILLSLCLFISKITLLLNIYSDLSFIIIVGTIWSTSNIFINNVNSSLISDSNQYALLSAILIINLYIINKLLIYLFKFHIYKKRISDWNSRNLGIKELFYLISIFFPSLFICIFLMGIYI